MQSLAVELVELIASFLNKDSLLQLRLSCRALQKKTFHHFARRCFASVKTDLSEESLGRLDALSQHQALRPYVQGLGFALQNEVGHGLVWDRHPWGPLAAPMEVAAIRRLRDNLIYNLPNCRSFFILCRFPEGHPDMTRVTMTDAMAVFFALVVDGSLPVSSFHLIYANQYSRTLVMDMRRIPKLLYRQPKFQVAWSHLQKLSLEQYLTLDNFGFLLELVLSAPNLRTLCLNLGSHDLACGFMHELAEMASFVHLQELAIFRTSIRASDLQRLLQRVSGTLASFTLYHVCLAPGDNWAPILASLRNGFKALQSISFYYLWITALTKELVTFPDLQKQSLLCKVLGQRLQIFYSEDLKTPSVLGIEYSGEKMSEVLSVLPISLAGT
ncbi:hypothetical protein N7492_009879 [Penicillium capsulatum]|uniref:F-box domain-containing protein n=1 Tax=Penicillium capsulatum TaxID=69766 RepID=A0A9W9LEG0_9EURO|nr:hypothetical protein N7492_009879 [Penicillium capsulatum]KAJ6112390.1 hypothetical protein N7512_007714 [Penicillium capsulatum]